MSPFTIDHGILGLEAVHRLSDEIDLNTQGSLPRIELDRITGIHALPDADDLREPTYGQNGEQVYFSQARGKTITYEGRILGKTLYELRETTHTLRHAASLGRRLETSMVITPDPAIGGSVHRFDARTLAFEVDDEQTVGYETMPTAWQRSFVLTMRQSDSRYYLVGGDITGGGASGATVVVNNPGTAAALPVFIVNGPVSGDLTFERLPGNVSHRVMLYENVTLASGQQLRLDFTNRSFRRVSDDEDYDYLRVFADSNWWDAGAAGMNPGSSSVKVTGGGTWTITFAPASV